MGDAALERDGVEFGLAGQLAAWSRIATITVPATSVDRVSELTLLTPAT